MRREKKVLIASEDEENRDAGKRFLIREMPADQAEEWAMRLLLAVAHSGVELPEGMVDEDGKLTIGMAGVAAFGLQALSGISWADAKPLLDEMMACVKYVPENDGIDARDLFPGDIEEITTRLKLRREVWELHTGFFATVARSISTSRTAPGTEGSEAT